MTESEVDELPVCLKSELLRSDTDSRLEHLDQEPASLEKVKGCDAGLMMK